MSESALDKAIQAAGGGRVLADLLGVSPMAISQWKKRGVPVERVPSLVRAAGGRIQAHELRPDLPDLFPAPSAAVAADALSPKLQPAKAA